ncbi:MAG TPA: hypothetical protein VGB03_06935 [Acidimicrobiales bacterium]
MGRGRRGLFFVVAATASVAVMAPVVATVYRTPGGEVAVATAGEDVYGRHVAVSNGGRAETNQGPAVSTTGDAWGYTAVSGTGCAYSDFTLGVSGTGCASSLTLAISGTGPVVDHPRSNGRPPYGISGTGCVASWYLALSGTGCTNGGVSVSVGGNAQSQPHFYPPSSVAPGVALSGAGDARGGSVTVAGVGDSSAGGPYDDGRFTHVAVSGAGNASNNQRSGLTLAPTGRADGGAVAVGGDDATAYGGLVAVSLTGDAHGGSVTNVCPMGRCN